MPEVGYIYSLSSDFSGGLNVENLIDEINNSSISVALSYVTCVTSADQVRIFFMDALSGGEQTTLNGLVTGHNSTDTVRPEEIQMIKSDQIYAMGPTGYIMIEDLVFTSGSIQPKDGMTGANIQNMIIDADNNTVINIDDDNVKVGAGININKLGNGNVDNTEFEYLNGVTSSIQTQLDGKALSGHTHVVADVTDFNSATDSRADARISLQKATAGGIATLDGGGKIPANQLNLNSVEYQGTWNASTNSPVITGSTGDKGHYYVVSVGGSTNIDGVTDWQMGDWIIYNGGVWEKADHTDQVTSVAGKQGAVVLVAADVTDFDTEVSNNTSVVANTSHAADASLHRVINDSGTSGTELWSASKINTELSSKSGTSHTHTAVDVTDFDAEVANNTAVAANTSHAADASKHRLINDLGTSVTELWSASKINTELGGKSDTGHNHVAADVTDFDIEVGNHPDVTAGVTHASDLTLHRVINDSGTGATELWSADKIDSELSGKSDTGHNHLAADITNFDVEVGNHPDVVAAGTHAADTSLHRVINDSGTGATELWSANKIGGELSGKSDTGHSHVAADVTDFDVEVGNHPDVVEAGSHAADLTLHRVINDSGTGATELWSASKIDTELSGKSGTGHNHVAADVTNFDVEVGNHPDVAAGVTHAADSTLHRVINDSGTGATELWSANKISGELSGKSDTGHNHVASDVTDFDVEVGNHPDVVAAGSHAADLTLHRVINDSGTSATELWSASKIDTELAGKSGTGHNHVAADVTDFDVEVGNHSDVVAGVTHAADSTLHRVINDSGTSGTELWSASKINSELSGKTDIGHSHVASDVTDFNSAADARADGRISAQKGVANGLATLDSGGKIPANQLDLDSVDYQGTWNADINSPSITGSTGAKGDYYVVSVAGTTNIDGITDWQVGDWIIYNGGVWEKADHTDQVTSVAGKQGAVVLVAADVTDFDTEVSNNTSVVANTNHAADLTLHRVINDSGTGATELWSANKISGELSGKSDTGHTHVASDVTDFDVEVGNHPDVVGAGSHAADLTLHRVINDSGTGAIELWSASKINSELSGKSGTGHNHVAADVTDFDVEVSNNDNVMMNSMFVETSIAGNKLISGSVNWVSGLIFRVMPADYIIDGHLYSSSGGQLTLDPADPTNDRIDVIYANTDGNIGVVKGTAGPTPVKPGLNYEYQIEITHMIVNAGQSEPNQIYILLLYDENLGTAGNEWNATETTSGARINLDSTNSPYSGSKSIELTSAITDDAISLTPSDIIDISNITVLEFCIKSKATWPSSKRIYLGLYYDGQLNGDWIIISEGKYGFNTSDTSNFYNIALDIDLFNPVHTWVDELKIVVSGGGSSIGGYIDQIRFQSGVPQMRNNPVEANMVSNIGNSGVGTFKQKIGQTFEFKKLDSNDLCTVIDNTGSDTISFQINESSITHQNLSGAGTNTHTQIDSHIADSTLHRIINDSGTSGVELWSASKINTELGGKTDTGHAHVATDITDFDTEVSNNTSVVANTSHAADSTLHRVINDSGTGATELWSASKIDSELATKSGTGHSHLATDVTDFDTEVANNTSVAANTSHAADSTLHRIINDSGTSGIELWSASKINSELSGKTDNGHTHVATDVTDFDTEVANNTAVAANTTHAADSTLHRIINDSGTSGIELWSASKINSELSGKTDTGHTHVAADVTDFNSAADSRADGRISVQKAMANGLATLDGGGKIPASQLNLDSVDYQGTWNALINSPTITSGVGTKGFYYVVSEAGFTNVDGVTIWDVGDWIIFNGSAWEKADHTDQVTSVAGKQGAVVLDAGDITDFDTEVGNNTAVAANTTHAADATLHRVINDSSTSSTVLWSASKISGELAGKSGTSHTHTATDVTDFDTEVGNHPDVLAAGSHAADLTLHRIINDSGTSGTELWSASKIDTELAGKSGTGHNHVAADVTDFDVEVGNHPDVAASVTHAADLTLHRVINDSGTSGTELWSASKISSELSGKTNTGHSHIATDITDFDVEVSNNTSVAANTSHAADSTLHRVINDSGTGATELWSASKIDSELSGKTDSGHNHVAADVTDFDVEVGNHPDVAAGVTHAADSTLHRVINDSGISGTELWSASKINTELGGKTDTGHTHVAANVTDFDVEVGNHPDVVAAGSHASDLTLHRVINDSGTGATELWSASKISGELSGKSGTGHNHVAADVTDFDVEVGNHPDVSAGVTHAADSSLHRVINDSGTSGVELWSASKINTELGGKTDTGHTHVASDVTNFDTEVGNHPDVVAAGSHAADLTLHRVINDSGTGATELWSASKIDTELSGKSEIGHNHVAADITDFDTEVSNNTSVAANTSHAADSSLHRVINDSGTSGTELWSASKISSELSGKTDSGHSHVASDVTDFNSAADARADGRISVQKGVANGLATLNGGGKIPANQLDLDSVDYQGTWNADSNSPSITGSTGAKGDYYVVSVAGTTNIDGITDWQVGDWIIYNGGVWEKADHTDQVTSVAGKQGAVTLVASDVTDFDTEVGNHPDVVGAGSHAADLTLHRVINDSGTGATELWSANKISGELSGKSDTGHTHVATDVTDFDVEVGNHPDVSAGVTHAADSSLHRVINDSGTSGVELWSASKISSELSGKTDTGHTHVASDVTDFDVEVGNHPDVVAAGSHAADLTLHRVINDSGTGATELWSASKISGELSGKSDTGHTHVASDVTDFDVEVGNHPDVAAGVTHAADSTLHRVINDSGTSGTELWSASKINTELGGKTDTGHTHVASDVTDFDVEVSNNTSVAANTSHAADSTLHRVINDSGTGATELWSASKIDNELSGKTDTGHNHVAADVTDFDVEVGNHPDVAAGVTHAADSTLHRVINDSGTGATELWSANKIDSELSGKSGTGHNHVATDITNFDVEVSNNTSVAANTSHAADSTLHRVINDSGTGATELWSASKINTELNGKTDTGHTHVASDVTDFDTEVGNHPDVVAAGSHAADLTLHRVINDSGTGATELWSASKINDEFLTHTHLASDITDFDAAVENNVEVKTNISFRNSSLGSSNQLLLGSANWQSGLTFNVSPLEYVIDKVFYTYDGGTITLDTADPTNDRIDVIFADTSGTIGKITGTPAPSPSKPLVDTETQIEITFITVGAGETSPSQFIITDIYLENAGTGGGEWNASENTSGTRIDLNSTNDPFTGTKLIEVIEAQTNDLITLTAGSDFDLTDINLLEFAIKTTISWANNRKLRIALFHNSDRNGQWVTVKDGTYGFDSSNTSTYQNIAINIGEFGINQNTINIIKIIVNGSGSNINFLLDQVRFQSGIPQTTGGGGEINTIENIGTNGVGIFKQKLSNILQLKKLDVGSNKISLTDNTANDKIDLDLIENNILHSNLSEVGTNTHAQIDTHLASTDNPHSVTASQVGNTGAQWNADKIQGVNVVSTAPTTGQQLTYNGTEWAPRKFYNHHLTYVFFDDFISSSLSEIWVTRYNAADCSTQLIDGVGGQIRLTSGGSTNDYVQLSVGRRTLKLDTFYHLVFRINVENISDTRIEIGGYYDNDNQIRFIYDSSVGSNWIAENISAGFSTTTDTTIPADTNWHIFEFNTTSTLIKFTIDNTVRATHTTNLPNNLMRIYLLQTSLSNNSKSTLCDYVTSSGDRPGNSGGSGGSGGCLLL